jgi:hypothetical protein
MHFVSLLLDQSFGLRYLYEIRGTASDAQDWPCTAKGKEEPWRM